MPSDQDPNLRIPSLSKASIAAATPIKQVFTPGFHGYAQSGNHLSDKYAGMVLFIVLVSLWLNLYFVWFCNVVLFLFDMFSDLLTDIVDWNRPTWYNKIT